MKPTSTRNLIITTILLCAVLSIATAHQIPKIAAAPSGRQATNSTPAVTPLPTTTATFTPTLTMTPTTTSTFTPTLTLTPSPTATGTQTATFTVTPDPADTDTPMLTVTPSPTATDAQTATFTATPDPTDADTQTPSVTFSPIATSTLTETRETPTPTLTVTQALTPTLTDDQTWTPTQELVPSPTPSEIAFTATNTSTLAPEVLPTNFIPIAPATFSPLPTFTPTEQDAPACLIDVDHDRSTTIEDLMLLEQSPFFGLAVNDPGWQPDYDVNHDGIFDVSDLQWMTHYLGTLCSEPAVG